MLHAIKEIKSELIEWGVRELNLDEKSAVCRPVFTLGSETSRSQIMMDRRMTVLDFKCS